MVKISVCVRVVYFQTGIVSRARAPLCRTRARSPSGNNCKRRARARETSGSEAGSPPVESSRVPPSRVPIRIEVQMSRCREAQMSRCPDVQMTGGQDVRMSRCPDFERTGNRLMMPRCPDDGRSRCQDVEMTGNRSSANVA